MAMKCFVQNKLEEDVMLKGTLTAGLSVLCCSQVRPKGGSKAHCIWINAGVGLLQFLLTFLFLLGWIWSIMWGVAFLTVSKNYSKCLQQENKRSLPKYMQRIRNKVPHKSSQLRKVSTSMNNRPTIENAKECNIHNHSANHCHLQQYDHQTKQCQQKTAKKVAPEAFSFSDASIAPSDTSSLIIQENSPTATTNSDVSPQECTLLEAAPEIASLEESAVLQSQCHGHKSETSRALPDLADHGAHQHTRPRRGIIIPSNTNDCSPTVTHRQTVVYHSHGVQTSCPDLCQKSRKPYQVCLTTVLK